MGILSGPANIVLSQFFRYLGDNSALALELTDPDTGNAFDPTGSILIFTLKANAADPDSAALIQKISTVGGFTVTDAPEGEVSLSLVPADFATLKSRKTYQIDVQAQNTISGFVKTVLRGTFLAEIDVTQATTITIPTYTTTTPPASGGTFSLVLAGIASAGADATKVCGLPTIASAFVVGSVLRVRFPGNIIVEFQLETNTGSSAGFLFEPYDYNAGSNPVQWRLERVTRLGNPCSWNADTGLWHDIYAMGAANLVALGADQTGFALPA